MIKFTSPITVEGTIKIKSPNDLIEIENSFTTPITMQLILLNNKKRSVRDIVHMNDHNYLSKPDIPKEFIESPKKITCMIALHLPSGTVFTNEIEVQVDKEIYQTIANSGDRIQYLENKVGELERLIKLAIIGNRIPMTIPKDLGQPKPGMVMTVLSETVFGWSDLFKEVITQINDIKTIDGKVLLVAKDIKLEDGTTIQDLNQKLIENNKTLGEVLSLLKENSEALAQFQTQFEEYKSQDVI